MQTIQLNEHLLQEAYQHLAWDLAKDIDASNNPTAVVEIVLREFIKNRSTQTIEADETENYESDAWVAGQGLFGCYAGSADLSENAKNVAGKHIKEKHAKRTS